MKKFKLFSIVALLFMGISFSSCLDIEEEYYFHKDGSGVASLKMDLSKMMEMLKMFQGMEGLENMEGMEGLESIDDIFNDQSMVTTLSRMPGVSNAKSLNDKENHIMGYSFEFKDIETLNKVLSQGTQDGAMSSLMQGMGEGAGGEKKIVMKGKKLIFEHNADQLPEMMEENEEMGQEMGMASMMMAEAKYNLSLRFDRSVKKIKKGNGVIGEDGKSILISESFDRLLSGEGKLSSQIKLK